MPIALKKEAIAVASGNHVCVFSYSGNVSKLVERPGEVLGLTIYQGSLLDAGKYYGVRNTLEKGKVVAGKDSRWRRIATERMREDPLETGSPVRETLYGAMETDYEDNFGIYELTDENGHPFDRYRLRGVHMRNGRTNVLAGWNVLIDAGDYYWYTSDRMPHTTLHSSFDYEVLILGYGDEDFSPSAFAAVNNIDYYYCTPLKVLGCSLEDPFSGSILTLPEFEDERKQLSGLLFKKDELSFRRFNAIFYRVKKSIPESYISGIHPLTHVKSADLSGRYIGGELLFAVERYVGEKYGFSALAIADGNLLIGRNDGKLIDRSANILHEFSHPVNALCTIPEEIFDGLRQRVVRNIQMKAVHARAKPVAVRRAA